MKKFSKEFSKYLKRGRCVQGIQQNSIPLFRSYYSPNTDKDFSEIISNFNINDFLENPDEIIEKCKDVVVDATKDAQLAATGGFMAKIAFFSPLLQILQSATGLPYWLTIAIFSSVLRASMIPMYYFSQEEERKTQLHQEEFNRIKLKQRFAKSKEEKDIYKKELYQAHEKAGIKTWRRLLVALPISLFLPMFASMKVMSVTVPLLKTGGFWWFTNLAVPDPYFILPMVNAFLLLANFKLNQKYLMTVQTPKLMKWFITGSILLSTIITLKFNACFFMFWIPLQLVQVGQTFGFYHLRKWKEKRRQNKTFEEIENDDDDDDDFIIVDSSKFYRRNDDDF